MSEDSPVPITLAGDLSKPATALIKKVSNAVGGLFKPYQIVRVAKAEAEADLIRAESEIKVTDLRHRAMHRFVEEEAKRQENMESITEKALPLLDEKSSPESVEDDWITNFFDKSRIVSDGDMQQLWSRVLAGEANSPGKFSRRTVNLLSDLDKRDAELFTKLCGFGWMIGGLVPLIFDFNAKIYNAQGITFNSLAHLETLGLIKFRDFTGFQQIRLPKTGRVFYFDTPLDLTFPKDSDNSLEVGKAILTHAGQELARVCDSKAVEGFFDFVRQEWEAKSLIAKSGDGVDASAGS